MFFVSFFRPSRRSMDYFKVCANIPSLATAPRPFFFARYEAYGNYVSTSVSTSLTSIKGVLGAVKTKARSVVGLVAGPAPIAVEPEPVYDAEVALIEELVAPVSG